MALCEFGQDALMAAENEAVNLSKDGGPIIVSVKCENPAGCNAYFRALAKDGNIVKSGINPKSICAIAQNKLN